ncbi:MAG: hypothetical protein ABSD20_10975, partial [Terriglobales bacterium]
MTRCCQLIREPLALAGCIGIPSGSEAIRVLEQPSSLVHCPESGKCATLLCATMKEHAQSRQPL